MSVMNYAWTLNLYYSVILLFDITTNFVRWLWYPPQSDIPAYVNFYMTTCIYQWSVSLLCNPTVGWPCSWLDHQQLYVLKKRHPAAEHRKGIVVSHSVKIGEASYIFWGLLGMSISHNPQLPSMPFLDSPLYYMDTHLHRFLNPCVVKIHSTLAA